MGTLPSFSAISVNGNNSCDFMYALLAEEHTFSKKELIFMENIAPKRKTSFL